jgi:hypothetical protein
MVTLKSPVKDDMIIAQHFQCWVSACEEIDKSRKGRPNRLCGVAAATPDIPVPNRHYGKKRSLLVTRYAIVK